LRTFVAGQNIAITNPGGITGNPVIAFTPAGLSTAIQLSIQNDTTGPIIPYTAGNDFLVWDGTEFNGSQQASTQAPVVPLGDAIAIHQNAFFGSMLGLPPINLDVNGRVLQVKFDTFAIGPYTQTRIGTNLGVGEPVQANLVNSLGVNLNLVHANNAAPGPFDAWRYRVWSYNIGSTVPGAGFNQNAAMLPLFRRELAALDGAGNFYGQAFLGTSFVVVSSKESKKSIEPASEFLRGSALDLISHLEPVAYRYKHQDDDSPKSLGLLVEDVAKVGGLDFLVHSEKDDPSHIRTDQIPFLLLQAIKELLVSKNFQKRD